MTRRHHIACSLLLLLVLALTAGCDEAPGQPPQQDSGPAADGPRTNYKRLVVSPASAKLTVTIKGGQKVQLSAAGELADGRQVKLTDATWSVDNTALGLVSKDGEFSASGAGGVVKVTATLGALSAYCELTIKLQDTLLDSGSTAADAKRLTQSVTLNPSRAPGALYPYSGTMIPANLPPMTFQWSAGHTGNTLFGLRIKGDNLDLTVATAKLQWQPTAATWAAILGSAAGDALKVTLLGTAKASAASLYASAELTINVSRQAATGTIYYWATGTNSSLKNGIVKIESGSTKATDYYTQANNGTKRCAGCHAISRDGTRLIFTEYPLGTSYTDYAKGVDVKTKKPFLPQDKHLGNFFAFSRKGDRYVAAEAGALSLHKVADGALIGKLSGWGSKSATHPDWSPTEDRLAYVLAGAKVNSAESFCQGSIAVAQISAAGKLSGHKVLVQSTAADDSAYYPTFSPDGKYLAFNRAGADNNLQLGDSICDAYANPGANLYLIDASGGKPVALTRANGKGKVTNSWPKWAPDSSGSSGVWWLAFSSTRDYGRILVNSTKKDIKYAKAPQIWITAVRRDQLGKATDPSYPAFWLPGQRTDSGNHIPFWTLTLK